MHIYIQQATADRPYIYMCIYHIHKKLYMLGCICEATYTYKYQYVNLYMIGCLKYVICVADCTVIDYIKQTISLSLSIYIYTYRWIDIRRWIDRAKDQLRQLNIYIDIYIRKVEPLIYIYLYIHMYIYRERESETNDEYMDI